MFNGIYQDKRVLVTGHSGFKGSWLCQWLLQLGAKVAGYSLYVPSTPSNYEVLRLADRVSDYEGDIRNLDQLNKVFQDFQPEIVFHLAAQSLVRRSYDEPKLTFETNLGGTINVLEVIRSTPSVRVAVLITSDKCYENVEWEYGYRETDRLGGKDPYSASKACAEIAFNAYVQSFLSNGSGPRLATARAGNVIGGGDWAIDRIVPDCIAAWAKQETAIIRNPHSTRPWQHVLEPLSGYLWLGAKMMEDGKGLSGEAFNFGPSAEVYISVLQLIEEIKKTWSKGKWDIDPVAKGKKHESSLLKLNCDKALNRLNWKPTLTFPETIELTAEWYLKYHFEHYDMIQYTINQISCYERLALRRKNSWTLA